MLLNKYQPYWQLMRLNRPTGIVLLLWPCLISLALAGRGRLDIGLSLLFIIGSILMRSAGCVFNDIIDKDIDKHVTRTKDRPLADSRLNAAQAIKLLITLLLISSTLLFFLKPLAIKIAIASLLLVAIYPFCKRFTYWPQLCLGIVYNLGVLIAWATIRGEINFPAILLYVSLIFWTLGYDTIYAHQDRVDDLLINVKSTAIKFGDKTEKYLNCFYTITATLFVYAGAMSGLPYLFYPLSVMPIILLFWQINRLDINDPQNCAFSFKLNLWVGATMLLSIILARYIYA